MSFGALDLGLNAEVDAMRFINEQADPTSILAGITGESTGGFGAGGFNTGSLGDEGADMVAQFRAIQSEGERMTAAVASSFINMASTAAAAAASGEASLGTLMQGISQMLAQLAASAIGGPLGGLAAAGIGLIGGMAARQADSSRGRAGREQSLNRRKSQRRNLEPRSSFV